MALGYHTPLSAKIALTSASFAALHWQTRRYFASGEFGEREGGGELLMSVATFQYAMFQLWAPPPVKMAIAARLAPYAMRISPPVAFTAALVVVGTEVSNIIDPDEGVQNFQKFISEPTKWKETTTKETLPIIYEHVVKPKVVDPLIAYGEKKYKQGMNMINDGLEWSLRGLPSIEYSI